MSFARLQTRTRSSSAFTLVELMIVIAIVGILATLVTVGVMKALEKGKMVSAQLEIGQLESAIAAAKTDLGNVEVLPSVLKLYRNKTAFENAANAINTTTLQPLDPDAKNSWLFINKAFGKAIAGESTNIDMSADILEWFGGKRDASDKIIKSYWPNSQLNIPVTLRGMEVLVFLLGGIPDADSNNKVTFQGFSTARLNPCELKSNSNIKRKGPYYQFDNSKLFFKYNGKTQQLDTNSLVVYSYKNSYEGLYAYFASQDYKTFTSSPLVVGGKSLAPFRSGSGINPYINPKTYQLINQGQDQTFGSGGTYVAGQGDYALGQSGYDDMANFAPDVLGKKDE